MNSLVYIWGMVENEDECEYIFTILHQVHFLQLALHLGMAFEKV